MSTTKTFEQRMGERIKKEMPALMTSDEIAEAVKKCIKSTFFTPRKVEEGYHTRHLPSLMDEVVEKEFRAEVSKQVSAYFEENKDAVAKMIKPKIDEGILACIGNAISAKFNAAFYAFGNEIEGLIQANDLKRQ